MQGKLQLCKEEIEETHGLIKSLNDEIEKIKNEYNDLKQNYELK